MENSEVGIRKNIAYKLVVFLRENGGIFSFSESSLATRLGVTRISIHNALQKLKSLNAITDVSEKSDYTTKTWALNESIIDASVAIMRYLKKYPGPDGAPIHASSFSENNHISIALFAASVRALTILEIICIATHIKRKPSESPNYLLLRPNEDDLTSFFKPKENFLKVCNQEPVDFAEKFLQLLESQGGSIAISTRDLMNKMACSRIHVANVVKRLEAGGKIVVKQRVKRGLGNNMGVYALKNDTQTQIPDPEKRSSAIGALALELNAALNNAVQAEEKAIRFGEELQKAKARIAELEARNEELEKNLRQKDEQTRLIETANDELINKSRRNQERLSELSKSMSV